MPVWSKEINRLSPYYQVRSVEIVERHHHVYAAFTLSVDRPHVSKDGKTELVWEAEKVVGPSTAVFHVYPLIAFSLLFAWPYLSVGRKLKPAVIVLVLVLAAYLVDPPLHVVGDIEPDPLFLMEAKAEAVPKGWCFNRGITFIYHFLNNGGRQFLAVLIFLGAVGPYHLSQRGLKLK